MEIKTKEHFRNLKRIFEEDGLLSMLDYDLKVSRARNKLLNILLAEGFGIHECTGYSKNLIVHYDQYGILRKLRLNPKLPEEFYGNPKWDFEYS